MHRDSGFACVVYSNVRIAGLNRMATLGSSVWNYGFELQYIGEQHKSQAMLVEVGTRAWGGRCGRWETNIRTAGMPYMLHDLHGAVAYYLLLT